VQTRFAALSWTRTGSGLVAVVIAALALGASGLPDRASAQTLSANPQRDCQTVRICNFARNAAVRGCLSSYTCRTCRLVSKRCAIGDVRRVCQKMECTWGG
jgi:hypothetical protein